MSKVECRLCSKEKDGKCCAKKNSTVDTTKHRVCSKYKEDSIKVGEEKVRQGASRKLPVYRATWRYYANILAGADYKENLFIRVK
jgi:hypothetical protein